LEQGEPEVVPQKPNSEQASAGKDLKQGNREVLTDKYINTFINNDITQFKNKIYIRLNAKKIKFTNVSFEHCVFDGCYLNNCVFDNCNFTGSKFIGCNLHQSTFQGCGFRYVSFERTQIDDDAVFNEAPTEDNLKMRFARTLRMNFQQVGDAKAVNKAIVLELEATASYLYKSWSSTEEYYKKKYSGLGRIYQFSKWIEFKVFDGIWGNGESIIKLARTIFFVLVGVSIYDMHLTADNISFNGLPLAIQHAIALFFGANNETIANNYPSLFLSLIIAIRLISLALLTSILVKRLGRR